ncbi:MAG: hypothetical protein Q8S96_09700 [Hydrogenophaga sp.]|uniref:hypothetical protein n=1 Tax=Hydrogenophaga sp. TaxID=1904254 RepID=UPI00271DB7EA|nr:hypothetical protein [Hydrogenophaga sp.]MDO9482965.1 hypothetical protein [Hydrogenophaga sp.]MDP3344715.1 hypothetical protein [Hydrogenophaga sp.]MDP3808105.1 hypothetical protein [Hydrogenophaga sp.]MDP3924268.1 hypothetical protein [Hydrogenophaga sp.]
MFNTKAFEAEMARITMQVIVWEVIAFVVGMFVLYFVLKAAIRDGINESKLGERQMGGGGGDQWRKEVEKAMEGQLPPMKAEK